MNWFTSDYHFNHDAVISFCNRPFRTVLEMNEAIIERHNGRVGKHDTVYFIGDFCFYTSTVLVLSLIERLNGNFVFVKGNHDNNNKIHTIANSIEIESYGMKIQLVHRPQDITEGYDFYLVGHVHEKWKFRENMCNVGVDVWDFYPVDLKQILKAYKRYVKGEGL